MTLRTLSLNPLRVGLISGLAVAGLLLSGCAGGQPQGSGTTSSSASASPSATTTPTPTPSAAYKPASATGKAENVPVPVLPEEAKKETKEGLEAFAKYWFVELNYAYETGDVRGFQNVSSASCKYCTNLLQSLRSGYESGRWVTGGKIQTPSLETDFVLAADGKYQVFVQVQQHEIRYFETGGNEYRLPTPPSDAGVVMMVGIKDGAFHLDGLHPLR
jgi:hypothetical protein